ncbi:MAG TPA: universal stress protein [Polyangia bacterium]|jgi:nucleotide-binding universal stress UspA family protein|nr:universal stress protein [Polyangia bacterium]
MRAQRILVPIDFSEGSTEAFTTGLAMAKESGAQLTLMHVLHVPMTTLPDVAMLSPDVQNSVSESVEHGLDMLCERAHAVGVDADWHVVVGSTAVEICALAEDVAADLIVIGSHGGGALAHAILGSVAERVVRKASCPVLTVRPQSLSSLHP